MTLPSTEVVVIGAGMAGLSCATRLAELGHRVIVLESRRVLGGRASSWIDQRSGAVIDNGPHLFAGAYREVVALLRRVGALDRVPLSGGLHVPLWCSQPPRRAALTVPAGTGRLGAALGLARFEALSWRERLGLLSVLQAAAAGDISPDRPLGQWLDDRRQSARSRRWFWDPLARAVFSDDPEEVSARLFAEVLRRLFLEGPAASSLAHASYGLSDTYAEPAARYLLKRGSEVLRGSQAKTVKRVGAGYEIHHDDGPAISSPGLCLAVGASVARSLLSPGLLTASPALEAAAEFPSAPIVSVNLWFRGTAPVLDQPFVGMVDGVFSWFFDRSALTEDAGDQRHVALVAPGARGLLPLPAAEIVELAMATLRSHGQGDIQNRLSETRVIKEPHAAPALTPRVESLRPAQQTAEPGLTLAGDWTATGLPATLESAATSGHRSAELLHTFLERGS